MKSLLSSKKGQSENYFVAVVVLFVMGFVCIMVYYVISQFFARYQALGFSDAVQDEVITKFLNALAYFDYIMVVLLLVLIAMSALTSYLLAADRRWFIVSFVSAIFFGFVSYYFNFIFAEFASQPIFTATLLVFPRTIMICTNLHWVVLAMFVIGSIALYGKKTQGQYVMGQ